MKMGAISKDGVIKELQVLDPFNRAVAFELQGKLYVPSHDALGHVRALLDNSGKCITTYRYSAFGEEQIQGNILSPWRYSGKRIDAETGLIYFGVRYYDSKTLCWLTPDPLEDVDGPNLYLYVLNNPMKYSDHDGHFAFLFAIPMIFEVFTISWGAYGVVASYITAEAVIGTVIGAAAGVALYQGAQNLDQVANGQSSTASNDKKKKNRDPKYPGSESDLEKNPEWSETSHPDQRNAGYREFTNGKTGEKVRFDKGEPNKTGHRSEDHYHRFNPNSRNDHDRYLDVNGNPTGKNTDASHLYPPI